MGEGGAPLGGTVPTEPGRYVLTLDVTWDGGEATFLHQIEVVLPFESPEPTPTIAPSPTPLSPIADSDLVVQIEGLGRSERSRQSPIMLVSFRGETALGCTEAFEWTRADLTEIDEVSGRKGSSLPLCSYDPLFVVPPRTPIIVVSEEETEVFVSRTTTPFYTGTDGIGVSVRWPDGKADFIAFFEVRYEDPVPRNILLDCPEEDRVGFPAPDGARITPGGSAYVRGNLAGFLRHDVIEQMTKRDSGGAGGWDGTWQVTRDGSVVATVEFPRLSGVACRGSGIGGV
jgi:hypothetical protein